MKRTAAAASVVGRDAMRELDARTIAGGTPSLELMERAGRAIADALCDESFHGIELPDRPRLLVVAGPGSNGGDGFVVARLLASERWRCTVALAGDEPADDSDAGRNLAEWRRIGGGVMGGAELGDLLRGGAADFDLGLDAIFGTGLARPVDGSDAELIHRLNESGLVLVATDIPSGLCSDTGVPLGVAVRCRATVTIGAAKPGLFLADGPAYAGKVRIADIGLIEPASTGVIRIAIALDEATTAGRWPRLKPLAHKGSRGHVLVVAGSRGKIGAAILAARGALRAGAGLVTVAAVRDVASALSVALPEAMTRVLPEDEAGGISPAAIEAFASEAERVDGIVIGPGLGTGAGAAAAVAAALETSKPVVLDADALNVIAAWDDTRRRSIFQARFERQSPAAILTPHPGEMARLVRLNSSRVQLSRLLFASNLAKELHSVVVLKGAGTVVASGRPTVEGAGSVAFNTSGNAGMASAGMGDVLAGICGAVVVRIADPFEAACLSVFVHGAAGDALALTIGTGFLASELADALPPVLASRNPA